MKDGLATRISAAVIPDALAQSCFNDRALAPRIRGVSRFESQAVDAAIATMARERAMRGGLAAEMSGAAFTKYGIL